jgi:hypothetical protein
MGGSEPVAWSDVQHAYGPADDLPPRFAAIRAAPTSAGDAIDDLWSALCHQETVYEASAVAVPTLLELARLPDLRDADRGSLLMLVVFIGRGDDTCWDGHVPWATVQRCTAAVGAIVPELVAWACETNDPAVRAAATAAGAYFPDGTRDRLAQIAPDDADPRLVAARHLLEAQASGSLTSDDVRTAADLDPDTADYVREQNQEGPAHVREVVVGLASATIGG